jgi:hypothetical protein
MSGPPVYQPAPPDLEPPTAPSPGALPDFASPGFMCLVFVGGLYTQGWIQTAIDQSPDHKPRPPETGLPGSWITVILMSGGGVATYAWIPTPNGGAEKPPGQGPGGGGPPGQGPGHPGGGPPPGAIPAKSAQMK